MEAVFQTGDDDEVLVTSSTNSMKRKSFRRFRYAFSLKARDKWMDDEGMNYFLMTLRHEEPRSAFFSTFFYWSLHPEEKTDELTDCKPKHFTRGSKKKNAIDQDPKPKLRKYNFDCVRRWHRKGGLFKKDYWFVPIHHNQSHWVVVVVDLRKKVVRFYDPYHSLITEYADGIFQYLKDLHKELNGSALPDVEEWRIVYAPEGPTQTNGYDCGIFAMLLCDFLSKGKHPDYEEADMKMWRKHIVLRILDFNDRLKDEQKS